MPKYKVICRSHLAEISDDWVKSTELTGLCPSFYVRILGGSDAFWLLGLSRKDWKDQESPQKVLPSEEAMLIGSSASKVSTPAGERRG